MSTVDSRSLHRMEPIRFSKPLGEAIRALKEGLISFSRARLIQEEGPYLKYEFTSAIFGFVDDVEFWLDEASRVVHFRSASRVGYSDLGANRRRMADITHRLLGKL